MIYIKLDVKALTNPKLLAAGPLARAVYINGLLYSKEHQTDGFIPEGCLPLLCLGIPDRDQVIAALVANNLWAEVEGGYSVGVDRWAEYQTTAAQVEQSQRDTRERVRKFREQKRGGNVDAERDKPVTPEHDPPAGNEDVTRYTAVTPTPDYRLQTTDYRDNSSTSVDGGAGEDATDAEFAEFVEDDPAPVLSVVEGEAPWWDEPPEEWHDLNDGTLPARIAQTVVGARIAGGKAPYAAPDRKRCESLARDKLANAPDSSAVKIFFAKWLEYHVGRKKPPYKDPLLALHDWADKREAEWLRTKAARSRGPKPGGVLAMYAEAAQASRGVEFVPGPDDPFEEYA